MNKKMIFPIIAAAAIGVGLVGVTRVNAQTASSEYPPIIQKLVQRFGLNEAEVKAVFDEERTQRQQEMRGRFEENLTQTVNNGELTEAQKQLIIAKTQELKEKHQSEMQNFENMTPEERKSVMEKHHDELEAWAEENNIDLKYLRFNIVKGKGMGFGPGWHMKVN